jgi:hypothetical protein
MRRFSLDCAENFDNGHRDEADLGAFGIGSASNLPRFVSIGYWWK